MVIVSLISFVLSTALISIQQAHAHSNTCISPDLFPVITGTPFIPSSAQPSVVLNEVLLSPHNQWNCAYQDTRQNAWIELYNLRDQPLDLYAARTCIDTGQDTTRICLPMGSIIPAHGFFTFFPYLAYYNLVPSTSLRLLLAYATVDQTNIPTLPSDISYARVPDGTGKWQTDTAPTINRSNITVPSPSPTPTPHKKINTPTKSAARSTTKKTRTGNTSTADQNATDIDQNQQTQNDNGTQTQWHNLQLPNSMASPSALNTTQDIRSTSSSPPGAAQNIPQKLLFSLLGVVGVLSLWWGWRRFLRKKV